MNKKILIVDDAVFMRKILRKILVNADFQDDMIREAGSGNEALKVYKEYEPDIMLLDLIIPAPSGNEVLKRILEWDPDAKVIVITAVNQDIIMKKALDAGATEFVTKPIDSDEVITKIKKILEG